MLECNTVPQRPILMPLSFAPSETRSIISLASLYIVRMLGLFMVLPVLTLSTWEYTGANVFLLGIALGVYGLTQAFLQIPYGLLSDRFGRKPLIAIGLLVFALGSLVAASAETVHGLVIGRALQGAGAISGVVMAMLGDLTTEKNRTSAMATIGASIGIAFGLSLILGPAVMALGGVRWIFWLTLLLSILGLMILLLLVPSPQTAQKGIPHELENDKGIFKGMSLIIMNTDLWRLNIGIFILHAVLMALFVVIPLLLQAAGIPQAQHSWVYLGVIVSSFCVMTPLIIIGERKQKLKTIFLLILFVLFSALLGLSFSVGSTVVVISFMVLFFIGFNYLEATLPSLMTKAIPTHYRGAGAGLFSTCQFLGAALGGIGGGWVYSRFGVPTLLLLCAGTLLFWCLLALGMSVPKRTHIVTENVVG